MAFDISKHRNVLLMILKDIYSDATISPSLGFKGGTALHLFYNLPRFSIDLDFDLLDEEKKEYVFKKILEIAEQYGKIKDKAIKKFTPFILLSYEEGTLNIKIEINARQFGSKYENKIYLGIPMKVMVIEDIFAQKLVAMYERLGKANRDIFDVWYLLKKNFPINKNIIEKITSMNFKEFVKSCIEKLEKLPDKRILSGVGELLDEKTKNWAKSNLKKDTLFLLKLLLENQK
jgi:predicted nucleotidyltransferase component of viral defense system